MNDGNFGKLFKGNEVFSPRNLLEWRAFDDAALSTVAMTAAFPAFPVLPIGDAARWGNQPGPDCGEQQETPPETRFEPVRAASIGRAAMGAALAAEPTVDPRAELKAFIAPGVRTTGDPLGMPCHRAIRPMTTLRSCAADGCSTRFRAARDGRA